MNLSYFKSKAVQIQIFGSIIYLILIFMAMIFYTGGTRDNPSIPGYSFWQNTLSDSGRAVAYSGVPNTLSMIIFSSALVIYAIAQVPFYVKINDLFNKSKLEKILSGLGGGLGIVASITLIGIAFTPADLLITPHMIFVYIGYASIFFSTICFTFSMYMNKNFPKIYPIILAVFAAIYFITLIMGIVGLALNRELMVIGQKIGRFANIGAFLILAYGIWKFEKK